MSTERPKHDKEHYTEALVVVTTSAAALVRLLQNLDVLIAY